MLDFHWEELKEKLGEEQFCFLESVSYLWYRRTGIDARNDVYREILKSLNEDTQKG